MKPGSAAELAVGAAMVAAIAIAFSLDRLWGWRLVGIAEAAFGAWIIVTRRVPYGIEGEPPVGYLTGGVAVGAGLVAVAIGAVFVFAPSSIDSFFGGSASNGN
jgi:hypothetical protein